MDVLEFSKEQITNSKGIIIYGAGAWGKIVCETLQQWGAIPLYFVDRFRQGTYYGIDIIKAEELSKYLDCDILICTPSAYEEVINILENIGFKRVFHILGILRQAKIKTIVNFHDRLPLKKLVEMYSYYMNRSSLGLDSKILIPQMSFSVTEACTLKCKKCNALMPYYSRPISYHFEDQLTAMNRMLETVDEILEFGFIGGEAFLNRELYKYLNWAIDSEKITTVMVVTNSTLMPDERTIECLKNKKCYLCIDDYGELSVKKEELEELAKREQINYFILKNDYWYDFGELTKRNYSLQEKKKVFENCPIRDCIFFQKSRLYRCQYAGNLVNLGFCNDNEEDYVEFGGDFPIDILRKKLIQLIKRKAPLVACDFCNDVEQSGKIVVAEQQQKRGKNEYRIQ